MTSYDDAHAVVKELREAQGDGSDWTEDLFKRAADMIEILTTPSTDDERGDVVAAAYEEWRASRDPATATPMWDWLDGYAAGFRRQGPITDAQVQAAANALERMHWDGQGCGTHGTNACSICHGPSPMTPTEISRAVLEAARDASPSGMEDSID